MNKVILFLLFVAISVNTIAGNLRIKKIEYNNKERNSKLKSLIHDYIIYEEDGVYYFECYTSGLYKIMICDDNDEVVYEYYIYAVSENVYVLDRFGCTNL